MKPFKSKTDQLIRYIEERIVSGDWRLDGRIPSERALGEGFQVSRNITRRALGRLEERGLLSRRKGDGTFVTAEAPEILRRARVEPKVKLNVTFVLRQHWARNSVFCDFHRLLRPRLEEEGIKLTAAFHNFLDGKLFNDSDVLLFDQSFYDQDIEKLGGETPKIVLFRNSETFDYVTTDEFASGYMAGRHLAEQRHRRIANFRYQPEGGEWGERNRGLNKAAEEFNLDLITIDYSRESELPSIYAATDYLFSLGKRFTAIVGPDDYLTFGIYDCIRSKGLKVPEDVSLISQGDIYFASQIDVPLTTVRSPLQGVVSELTKGLKQYLTTGTLDMRTEVPPSLVIRESVAKNTGL